MLTLTDALARRFGRTLWEMGRAEAVGLAVVALIRDDPMLSSEERAFIADHLIPEERRHARITRRWAATWAPAPRNPSDLLGATYARDGHMAAAMRGPARLAWTVAILHWGEKNACRSYPAWVELFARLSPAMAADFLEILADERTHLAWSRRLVARIKREDVPLFRRYSAAKVLVDRIYPTVARSHSAIFRELKEATGGK